MAAIERTGTGVWQGDLREGTGKISSTSGELSNTPFSFATRFKDEKGTNPEELIAAAQAACYSMAFANYLNEQGYKPEEISTRATIALEDGAISRMHMITEGKVSGLEAADFERLAEEAERKCPVANLLRNGLAITLEASLVR